MLRARAAVEERVRRAGIDWVPLIYHRKPPVLAQLWDLWQMDRRARQLHRREAFELVHCRSYPVSLVGLRLQRSGIPFLFDMRGFWADERRDGNLWPLGHLIYDVIYRFFKRKEREFLRSADGIICLTHRAVEEIQGWDPPLKLGGRIEVIPCCCDLEHFRRESVDPQQLTDLREQLKIDSSSFVLSYLGSLGTWYLLDEMLAFFKALLLSRPDAVFLFITPDPPEAILARARAVQIPLDRLRFHHALRESVPTALALSRMGLFFIKPAYSKRASSPTKLAEYLSLGLPVISNAGVGDGDWLASRYPIGPLVSQFEEGAYLDAIGQMDACLETPPQIYRGIAQDYFSLEGGVERYRLVYERIRELKSSR